MTTMRWAICMALTASVSATIAAGLTQAGAGPSTRPARVTDTQVIEAQEFHVRDAAGNIRARLGVTPDGPILTMWNADSRPQVQVYVDAEGPHMVLSSVITDPNAPPWEKYSSADASLHVGDDGPVLTLSDSVGKPRARMSVVKNTPGLELLDREGRAQVSVQAGSAGPVAIVSSASGHPRTVLHLAAEGPAFSVTDAAGKTRVSLRVGKDGASLSLLDANGQVVWSPSK
jgi:hypothetical protein